MPSSLKDRASGRLGRLLAALRPGRTGPLPVQTGFPTSLADLVVKNHGRLKKPSPSSYSKRKKRRPSPSPPLSPSPPPAPPVAAVVLPPAQPKPDLSPVPTIPHRRGAASSLGLEFLALGGVGALALLVIWSKKLVAAITVASFLLFLLESLKSSAPRRPRPCPEATTKLDLQGRGFVSPIREIEAEAETPRPSYADSHWGSEISSLSIEITKNDSSNPKATKKTSWRKLIAKKLNKGRKCKEVDSSVSSHSRSNQAAAEVDSNAGIVGNEALVDVAGELPSEIEQDGVQGRFPLVAVVFLVLLGLVAGKLPAVVFTVLCFAFSRSIERLRGAGGEGVGRGDSRIAPGSLRVLLL